jgi:hypothetical protein
MNTKGKSVDGTAIIIIILTVAGVVAALLVALKGILDQLPDVFDSARRARDAWKRLKEEQGGTEEPPPVAIPADDEEPPAAA